MTSEEAKWNLMDIRVIITWCVPDEYLEALDVAIRSLDRQIPKPFIWKDGNPICPACGEEVRDMEWCNSCGQRLDHMPSVQQKQSDCEDCIKHGGDWECDRVHCHKGDVSDTNVGDTINRQAAIDALDVLCQEHRYKIPGKKETYSQYNEAWQDALDRAEGAIFNLPSAQPEYKELQNWKTDFKGFIDALDMPRDDYRGIIEYIDEVPPAQPDKDLIHLQKEQAYMQGYADGQKPRKGKWIDDGTEFGCCCSECGSTLDDYFDGLTEDVRLMKIPDFCLSCGADMREGGQE